MPSKLFNRCYAPPVNSALDKAGVVMKTTIFQIVKYWEQHKSECGLSIDWAEAHERCWRCSYKSKLKRCHIVPDSLGGNADPSNLVLLCGRCHREAPNVADSRFMWAWLCAHAVPFYDTYWTIRGMMEFEHIFKRKPFEGFDDMGISEELIRSTLKKHIKNTTVHFGEGLLNPSTIVWVFLKVEAELLESRSKIAGASGPPDSALPT